MFVQYFAIVYGCMHVTIVYLLVVMVLCLIKCLGFHCNCLLQGSVWVCTCM